MIDRSRAAPRVDMRSLEGRMLLGGYLLQKCVGEGNFGAVYRSEQQFLGRRARRVAVKLSKNTGIDIETARDLFADAFMLSEAMDEMTDTEARSHLVHVYDMGLLPEENDRAFIVMEYVQGTTLAAQFQSLRRVPAAQLLKWVRQICSALKGLHTLSPPLLHRDLKPDNVLIGVDLGVRVVDFGLAARLMDHGYVAGAAGPIAYMAPETSCGKSVPASDVYSIGLILYEGLAGELPFAHLIPPLNLPDVLHRDWLYRQKITIRPTPPSQLNNTVTPELDIVVLRCLEFEPQKRYQSAGELLKALDLDTGGLPPPANDMLALGEARRLRSTGDLNGALETVERGLSASSSSKETQFWLMYEKGEILSRMQKHGDGAEALVKAWEYVKETAILRTRESRAELLKKIADAYDRNDNGYQARKYKDLIRKELPED